MTASKPEVVGVMYPDGQILTRQDCGTAFEICCKVNEPLIRDSDHERITKKMHATSNELAGVVLKQMARMERLESALNGLLVIVSQSEGVAGYHLNGAVAEWNEFDEVRAADAAMSKQDSEWQENDHLSPELAAAIAAREEAISLVHNLKQQAQIHAQEARTANSTIAEIYQIVTGKTGEPGNWNGAEPVRKRIAELEAERKEVRDLLKAMFPKHVVESLAALAQQGKEGE